MGKYKIGSLTHIIFDWSGTISDDRKLVHEANMRVLESHGLKRISYAKWLQNADYNAVGFYRRMGISGDADELVLETISHFNHLKENGFAPSIYPGAEEALRSIRSRGIDISVLSGHPKSHVVDEARGYGIETLFSRIIGSVKNKSKELLSLLREIPSQSAAYVGDMTYDITSARAAGIMPISVTTGYQNESLLRYENPDLLVGSIAELDTILRNR